MFQDQALLYSFKIYIFIFLFFAQFGYIFHMEKHSIIFMKPYKNLLVKPCGIEGQKIWATSPKNNMLGTLILPFIQQHDLFLNMKQTRKHFQSDNEFAETSSQREARGQSFHCLPHRCCAQLWRSFHYSALCSFLGTVTPGVSKPLLRLIPRCHRQWVI